MNTFTKKGFYLLTIFLLLSLPYNTFAQEWSSVQKEVWKNVEAYWEASAKNDLEGFLSYFHDSYLGWSNSSQSPSNKMDVRKWVGYELSTGKVLVYSVKPLAIQVYGEVAFTHYFYSLVTQNKEGKDKFESGRWTDILIKQGNKWVLIGDQGGKTSKDN